MAIRPENSIYDFDDYDGSGTYAGIKNSHKKASDHKESEKYTHDPYEELLILARHCIHDLSRKI